MKTKFLLSLLLSFSFYLLSSQVPQGFNYQAIARDVSGNPIINQTIQVKVSILSDTTGFYAAGSGTYLWEEQHSVTTSGLGSFSLVIGTKAWIQGSATSFNLIDWNAGQRFVGIKIQYPSPTWKNMGTAKLNSVPYSMVAEELGGAVDKLLISGKATSMTEALFEVKNNNGQTIFAVYNEGVRIYVSDGDPGKGAKGGFAIGGFDMSKGVGEYLRVSKDSVRIYLNQEAKTKKGGFAIGGFDMSKNVKQDYLIIDQDSIRMYIKDAAKGAKGGFAIGGFSTAKSNAPVPQFLSVSTNKTDVLVKDPTKGFTVSSIQAGVTKNFMEINPLNNFFGEESGKMIAPAGDNGKFNSFMGFQSGKNTTSGSKNVMIGYQAGLSCNSSFNILIGNESGKQNTGDYNMFIGHGSGILNQGGNGNLFMGYNSGGKNTTGYANLFFGVNTGSFNEGGNNNIFIGNGSGGYNVSGIRNVCIGNGSGTEVLGDGNVMIGYQAGGVEAGSNKLFIDNSGVSTPLIWGDFTGNRVVINGNATNNISSRTFYVNGAIGASGGYFTESDLMLKRDISTIPDALNKVLRMHGVNFYWKDETNREPGMQMGFIAQEVSEVIPEVVSSKGETLSMQYEPVTALLVEAMKEQQTLIENQKVTIEQIRSENEKLRADQQEIIRQIEIIKKQLAEKK